MRHRLHPGGDQAFLVIVMTADAPKARKVIPIAAGEGTRSAPVGDGWERLSTLSEPRLSEMAENYRALGYEVDIRDVQQVNGDGCNTCFDAGKEMGQSFGTLYVRRQDSGTASDELFD